MSLYEFEIVQSVDAAPSLVIVLVHGTFAPNAKWTLPRSSFHKALQESLPVDTCIFRFPWTGRNSALDREEAAKHLRLHLKKSHEANPGVPHIIVGHSHGGNVALRAVAKTEELDLVRVLCLSTPIITALPRPRSDARTVKRIVQGAAFFLGCAIIDLLPGLTRGRALSIAAALAVAVATAIVPGYAERYLACSQKFVDLTNVYEGLSRSRVLFLRYPGDLATMALSFFQGVQWLINLVIERAAAAAHRSFLFWDRLMGKGAWRFFAWSVLSLAGGAALAFLINLIFGPAPTPDRNIVLFIAPFAIVWAITMLSIVTALFLSMLTALLMPPLILLGIKPVGIDLALASLWLELTFESAPIGASNVITLPTLISDAELRHSLGYEERAALEHVVRFTREAFEAPRLLD